MATCLEGEGSRLLQERWGLDTDLANRCARVIEQFTRETGIGLEVISGYRSPEHQQRLADQGRPAAPVHLSNHTICPARAADFRMGTLATNQMKAHFGRIAVFNGLRWGGGSPVDPSTGIPSDWNHLDLGPRPQ